MGLFDFMKKGKQEAPKGAAQFAVKPYYIPAEAAKQTMGDTPKVPTFGFEIVDDKAVKDKLLGYGGDALYYVRQTGRARNYPDPYVFLVHEEDWKPPKVSREKLAGLKPDQQMALLIEKALPGIEKYLVAQHGYPAGMAPKYALEVFLPRRDDDHTYALMLRINPTEKLKRTIEDRQAAEEAVTEQKVAAGKMKYVVCFGGAPKAEAFQNLTMLKVGVWGAVASKFKVDRGDVAMVMPPDFVAPDPGKLSQDDIDAQNGSAKAYVEKVQKSLAQYLTKKGNHAAYQLDQDLKFAGTSGRMMMGVVTLVFSLPHK